jgi:histidine triad (HIT) family protein
VSGTRPARASRRKSPTTLGPAAEKASARCFFCDRAGPRRTPRSSVYEGPEFIADVWDRDEPTAYLGQIVLQTRRHVTSLGELSVEEGAALGPLLQRLSRALQATVASELVYLDCYMEVVRHVHFFLTPRYPGTPPEYWRLRVTDWSGAPRIATTEIPSLARRLRRAMARA